MPKVIALTSFVHGQLNVSKRDKFSVGAQLAKQLAGLVRELTPEELAEEPEDTASDTDTPRDDDAQDAADATPGGSAGNIVGRALRGDAADAQAQESAAAATLPGAPVVRRPGKAGRG